MCMGENFCLMIIVQACSKEHADDFFLNSTAHWARTAETWSRVKITADATVQCRPKMIIDTHSIKFLGGHLAPIGCNPNYANFHEIPALGLIYP